MDERPIMPPEIAKAVIAVKKEIKALGKDQENKFARYKYVSVDKFYEVIGPLMAAVGLFVVVDESACSVEKRETQSESGQVKSGMWLTANYDLTLFHESGVQYGPIHRTITVAATGPQAFGSGMSYVEKYFLRSLFKIPTGEEDADASEQEGVPTVAIKSKDRVWGGPLNRTDFKEATRKFAGALADCNTARHLEDTLAEYGDLIKQMKTDMPGWWSGESDANGAQPFDKRIAETKQRIGQTDFTRAG